MSYNIPAAFANSASQLLSLTIVPYVRKIAQQGVQDALTNDQYLRRGLTTYQGKLTLAETARKYHMTFVDPVDALSS